MLPAPTSPKSPDLPSVACPRVARVALGLLSALVLVAMAVPERSLRGAGRGAQADEDRHPAYEIKAMYLRNFAMFTSWPREAFGSSRAPLVVAVVGRDPFGPLLEKHLGQRVVGTRKVELRRYTNLDELGPAHMVFLGEMSADERDAVLERYAVVHTLVIGEETGLALNGGTINFYFERDRVRFEINPAAAKRAELVISSQLLKLARVIREEVQR